jgi:quinol monooxygenase YgiN
MAKEGMHVIVIAGHVHVDPQDVDEFITDAQRTYPVAVANPGNLLISFCADIPAGTITVLEQWISQEALDQHLAAPEVVAIFTKWGPRMRNDVRKFDAINERDPRAL